MLNYLAVRVVSLSLGIYHDGSTPWAKEGQEIQQYQHKQGSDESLHGDYSGRGRYLLNKDFHGTGSFCHVIFYSRFCESLDQCAYLLYFFPTDDQAITVKFQ